MVSLGEVQSLSHFPLLFFCFEFSQMNPKMDIVFGKFKGLLRGDIDDKPRFILLVVCNLVTIIVAILGASRVSQFADYVLSVFMCNVMLYVMYYVGMKLYNKEPVSVFHGGIICVSSTLLTMTFPP